MNRRDFLRNTLTLAALSGLAPRSMAGPGRLVRRVPFSGEGEPDFGVRHGEGLGDRLGYPTANLDFGEQLIPRYGIYAARVEVLDGPHAGIHDGVAGELLAVAGDDRPAVHKRRCPHDHIQRCAGIPDIDYIIRDARFVSRTVYHPVISAGIDFCSERPHCLGGGSGEVVCPVSHLPFAEESRPLFIATAAAKEEWEYRSMDYRRSEGPIPVECRIGSCGYCWVGVLSGKDNLSELSDYERKRLQYFGYDQVNDPSDSRPPIRLACQAQCEGDVTLAIAPWNGELKRRFDKTREKLGTV